MTLRSPLLALGVLALAACADPVAPRQAMPNVPGDPNFAVVQNSTDPVQFTLPFPGGPTCGLTTTVTGTGEFHTVTRVSQSNTGVWKVTFSLSAHGTASGADGSRYVFNYANSQEYVNPVDPTTAPAVGDIIDHFNLIGQGKTPDLRVFLKGKFTFPDFEPVDDPVVRGLDIFCDPI